MEINEQTAQLILDALYWCNRDWEDSLRWEVTEEDLLSISRGDFVRFCKERGIETVTVVHKM